MRTLLSGVTPDSFTLVESGVSGQLNVLHERDWDAEAAPEWLAVLGQQRVTQTAGINQRLIADDFVSVDVNKTYGLSGWARSGDNFGMRFNPLNQQSFGLEEYDVDYLRIEPKHVQKYGSAVDTTLANALNPGDTQIRLSSITGWSTSAIAATRAFAWYGYQNKAGTTYADYTYTRNVATGDLAGLWSPGGVNTSTRTITLNVPWSGPALAAGTAVRNATSAGADHTAIALNRSAVPADFTPSEYAALIGGGTATNGAFMANRFSPGTAFVRPVILANQHGQTDNFITWQDVRIQELPASATLQDVRQPVIDLSVDLPGNQTMRLPLYSTGDTEFHIGTQARIQVSPTQRYHMSIDSIDMTEEDLNPVGFYSYDADGKLIHSLHVTRHSTAVDTRLARAVQPGDTAIYVNDATGWSNAIGSTAESRSLAWYGYRDSSGTLYADYTYTRNVAFDFLDGLWNVGGITFDTAAGAWKITLRSNWSGPAIPNGTAVRNATGHDAIQLLKIPTDRFFGWGELPGQGYHYYYNQDNLDWFTYRNVIGGGVWQNGTPAETTFRPGTKFVQPAVKAVVLRRFAVELGPLRDQGLKVEQLASTFDDRSYVMLNRSRQWIQSDQLVPVSPNLPVILSVDGASGTTMDSGVVSSEKHSIGYVPFDADGLKIESLHVRRYSTAVDTTLAQAVQPGDTQIVLSSAAGWSNVDVAGTRAIAWYGYRDSSGHLYGDYTYTRNVAADVVSGLWDLGGITGNVITLRQPWTGPTLAAGTAVRNAAAADDLIPVLRNQAPLPNQWTTYSASLSGTWSNGVASISSLPPGTAAVRIAVRANESNFTSDDTIHIRNASVTKSTGQAALLLANNMTVATLDVLVNDAIASGNVSLLSVSSPHFGTAQIIAATGVNSHDTVRYQSNAWYTGTDQFSYTARNNSTGETWTTIATVSITADNLANDAARASSIAAQVQNPGGHAAPPTSMRPQFPLADQWQTYDVEQGQTLRANNAPLTSLKNTASDADGDLLSYQLVSGPGHGSLLFRADGTFEYTPQSGFVGTDSFEYSVTDGLNTLTRSAAIRTWKGDYSLLGNRMLQIATAFHVFHDVYSRFGYADFPGSRDTSGTPFLSWRVQLLPYLGYQELYNQFRLNEAWNSPHNLALLPLMPNVFRSPGDTAAVTTTRFQTISDMQDLGNASLSSPSRYILRGNYSNDLRLAAQRDFLDGLQNTILFLQTGADAAVPWTAPLDVDHDSNNPFSPLGSLADGRMNVALADGQRITLSTATTSAATFNALVTLNGGELVDGITLALRDAELNPGPRMQRTGSGIWTELSTGTSRQKLKELGLAMHNFADAVSRFPNANVPYDFDANGRPNLSWRVELLRQLGYENLYWAFDHTEPWNSPHNLALLDKMPDIFRSVGDSSNSTTSRFHVLSGPDAAFGRDWVNGVPSISAPKLLVGPRMQDFVDGMSNTLLVAELGSDKAVPWTAPDEVIFDPQNMQAALGSLSGGVLPVLLADGTVLELSTDLITRELPALASRDKGEVNDGQNLIRLERSRNGSESGAGTRLKNQLKWVGLAMHNYHDAYHTFPVQSDYRNFGPDGRPFLSWRVHILPFLEQSTLYSQFNLFEPWDSPRNIQLLHKMPAIYRSTGDPSDSTTTRIQVFTGPEALFESAKKHNWRGPTYTGPTFQDIRDGSSDTILAVEAGASKAIPWTKPDDLEFDPNDPLSTMGLSPDDVFTAVMADGSVRQFSAKMVETVLRAAITPAGGEIMQDPITYAVLPQGKILPGITVAGTTDSRLVISEGKPGAVQVVLDKPGNVTIDVTLSADGVVLRDKLALTFTTANWNVPQAVTLKAIDDDLIDGAESVVMTLSVNDAETTTNEFDALSDIVIPVFNINDDVPRILTTVSGGITLTEGAVGQLVDVRLSHRPTSNVTIAVSSLDSQQAEVSVASLIFTPSNWSTPQPVTITSIDDQLADGNVNTALQLHVVASTDAIFRSLVDVTIPVTVIDNEIPELLIQETGGNTVVSEDGLEDTISVRLVVQPVGNVIVSVQASAPSQVQVSSNELVFTSLNWNVAQTITVSGVNNSMNGENPDSLVRFRVDPRSSAPYRTAGDRQAVVKTLDDEVASLVFANANETVTAFEGGQAGSYRVRLSVAPVGPVQVNFVAMNPDELEVQNGILHFNATNWDQLQTVTFVATEEDVADGNHYEPIQLVWGPILSAPFLRQPDSWFSIPTVDNEIASIEVVETNESTEVTELGATDSFGVRLSSRPNGPIELTVTSLDQSAVSVSPATLRFTPQNWHTLQTVNVAAVDDLLADGVQSATIRLAVNLDFSSGGYNHTPSVDVSTTTLDNEVAGLIIFQTDGSTVVSESRSADTVAVRLTSAPVGTVSVFVAVSDPSEAAASPLTLTFTPANWQTNQIVSIRGLDDSLVDGLIESWLTFTIAANSPGGYFGAPTQSVTLKSLDNEVAALIVTETSGFTQVSESASSDTITVRLSAQPVGRVILRMVSTDSSEFIVSPSTIEFDASNWNVPQTLTVRGVDDTLIDGPQFSTLQIRVAAGSQAEFLGLSHDVRVTTTDDELQTPVVLSPVMLTSSQRPVISWTSVAGAVAYEVIVHNRTTGVNYIVQTTVSTNRFQSATALGIGAFTTRVRAVSSTGRISQWSSEYRFRINTAPTMVSMPSRVNSPKPTFRWKPLAGAVYYDLQVDNVLNNRPQVIRQTRLTQPLFVATANLPLGLYEVKVRAIDAAGLASKWSTLISFYIVTAPVPVAPVTPTFSQRPLFSWQKVGGAVEYDLKYQHLATGQTTTVNAVPATSFRPAADLSNGAYRWWVRARDMYHVIGAWSVVKTFHVGGAPQLLPMGPTLSGKPQFEWTRVDGAVRYFLRVDRIDLPASYVVRQEFLTSTSYLVSASLRPGTYRVWVKAISGSGQITGWSRPVDFTVAVLTVDQQPGDDASVLIHRLWEHPELISLRAISKTSWSDTKIPQKNEGTPTASGTTDAEDYPDGLAGISASPEGSASVPASANSHRTDHAHIGGIFSHSERLPDVVVLDEQHPKVRSGVDELDSVTQHAFAATDWFSLL